MTDANVGVDASPTLWHTVGMLKIDTTDIDAMVRDLEFYKRRAYPFATKQTINDAAFATRKQYINQMRSKLTTRNRWTQQSARVETSRTLDIGRQSAHVGSIEGYMERQETGGTIRDPNIATATASNEGDTAYPRKRLPTKRNRRANIRLAKRRRAKTPAQDLVFKAQDAVNNGNRLIYLDGEAGPTKGIYRIVGGRKTKRGWPKGARLRMLWDMSRSSVRTPATPMLSPATDHTSRRLPELHRKAVMFQLKRHGLFE